MSIAAIGPGKTALVTGGAGGIGLAAARAFAEAGMSVIIVDLRTELFNAAVRTLEEAGAPEVLTRPNDVTDADALAALASEISERFGGLDVLMCNAGIQTGSDIFDTSGTWDRVLAVNLGGVMNCCRAFAPAMIARGAPGLIINTGSKQGITTPPGDPAYNVSKAGVKVFTEALQHHLRQEGASVTAHLFVPGFVFTDLIRRHVAEKPPGAWMPEEAVAYMLDRLADGDFYILCPDNEVTREIDAKRMAWAMGDVIENRPPLSRWHPDWADAFRDYSAKP